MIRHFLILSRQQRTAIALSSSPSLFSFSRPHSHIDPCFSDWLLAALSVSSPCSVPWRSVMQGKLLCGWLRELSGKRSWCRYSSYAAALSPFFLLQTRSRLPMHQTSLQAFAPGLPFSHIYSIQQPECFSVCHPVRPAFLCVCLQSQHSGSVLQLSCLNGCSEMSGKLNVFIEASQPSFA